MVRDAEWELAVKRAGASTVLHYIVCPHSPPRLGTLLNRYGQPVLTKYEQVDWKALASAAKSALVVVVPKKMSAYVANDGVCVMDVLHVSTLNGRTFTHAPQFEDNVRAALSKLTMKDMRAGITKISEVKPGLHNNTTDDGMRPPLGALIMSIKYQNGMQILDYADTATNALFGAPVVRPPFPGSRLKPVTAKMPHYLKSWLEDQFGVVYGDKCTMSIMGKTFSF